MKRRAILSNGLLGTAALAVLAIVSPAGSADNTQARAAYEEANRLFDQGQFNKALDFYKVAITEDVEFVDAYHNLALAAEMVDRQQALEAWKRFIDVAEGKDKYKFDVARIRARVQILERMPSLPESLRPSRYDPAAGDYYWNVSLSSEGEEWKRFPLKVFLGSAPQMKWQEGTRQAYDTWAAVFPLQMVARSDQADIRIAWENRALGKRHAGEEMEWVEFKREGDALTARRIAVISVDLSFNWDKDDMRAIISHELGHALGIKGHSDTKRDIMFMEIQRREYGTRLGGYPIRVWKSLVKQPSQRDINTLIRLYNHAGSSVRFK